MSFIQSHRIKRNLDFGTGLLWIMDYEIHGILMSIFTDFIAFKSSLFKCNKIVFSLASIRWVFLIEIQSIKYSK